MRRRRPLDAGVVLAGVVFRRRAFRQIRVRYMVRMLLLYGVVMRPLRRVLVEPLPRRSPPVASSSSVGRDLRRRNLQVVAVVMLLVVVPGRTVLAAVVRAVVGVLVGSGTQAMRPPVLSAASLGAAAPFLLR